MCLVNTLNLTGMMTFGFFINNRLVVDIGGQHNKVFGSVNLDIFGLTPGETYPFHIFYAERKRYNHLMMRTSMDLRTERSYFPTDVSPSPLRSLSMRFGKLFENNLSLVISLE